MYLSKLGVWGNLEMLKLWCEVTPEIVFPDRKIGHLKAGYEASFVMLEANPLDDFENVKKIQGRFKQGEVVPNRCSEE